MARKVDQQRDSVDEFLAQALPYPQIDRRVEAGIDRISKIYTHLGHTGEQILGRFGLNRSEFRLLLRLRMAPEGRMTAGELSGALVLTSGAMTKRLDALEHQSLIRRQRDARDRRAVFVSLTETGAQRLDEAVDALAVDQAAVWRALTRGEQDALNDLLRKLLLVLEA